MKRLTEAAGYALAVALLWLLSWLDKRNPRPPNRRGW